MRPVGGFQRVLWTRGKGCQELADLISGATATRVTDDPAQACVDHRADLLVSRRLPTSFDLVDMAAPIDVDPAEVRAVVAAVGGGPHSRLAASLGRHLGGILGVPVSMVSAYPPGGDAAAAVRVVEEIFPLVPDIEYRTMETADMGELVGELDPGSLLVFGAPGGSWLQRTLSGPGARLRSHAPAGAVVVRSAPRRVFQEMGEPVFVAPMLQARDMLRMRPEATLAVADGGRLVGLVRRDRLSSLAPDTPVSSAMEDPISIGLIEPVEAARPLLPIFGADPIPVVDGEDHLVGGLIVPAA